MIWEQNSEIVLMLTNLIENGSIKCQQYWPDEASGLPSRATYGAFSVTVVSKQESRSYIRRKLTVRSGSETRSIEHFHYTAWPDHGVPSATYEIVEFRNAVRRAMADLVSSTGPVLAHCSAGRSCGGNACSFMTNAQVWDAPAHTSRLIESCVRSRRRRAT